MSTGNAAIQISDPPHGHVVSDGSESVRESRILVLVRAQVSNERRSIRNGIGIGQILVIGHDPLDVIGGQHRERDRGVHAETIAGDRPAVNGRAGDRCVLDRLRCAVHSVSVRFFFSALASSVPTGPSRFGGAGTVLALVSCITQSPLTKRNPPVRAGGVAIAVPCGLCLIGQSFQKPRGAMMLSCGNSPTIG